MFPEAVASSIPISARLGSPHLALQQQGLLRLDQPILKGR